MGPMRDYSEFGRVQALQSVFGDQAFVKNTGSKNEAAEAKAKEFEGLFIAQMLEHLFPEEEDSEMFGGGEGESVYRSMMIEQYSAMLSRHGGIGVSDAIKRQLLLYQEVQP